MQKMYQYKTPPFDHQRVEKISGFLVHILDIKIVNLIKPFAQHLVLPSIFVMYGVGELSQVLPDVGFLKEDMILVGKDWLETQNINHHLLFTSESLDDLPDFEKLV